MKHIVSFVTGVVVMSSMTHAQLLDSAYPIATQNVEVKSISLGNANVSAIGKLGDNHLNPAGIGLNQTIQVQAKQKWFGVSGSILSFKGAFTTGNSSFSYSLRKVDTGEMYGGYGWFYPEIIQYGDSDQLFINGTYAYTFKNGFRVGGGINYYQNKNNRLKQGRYWEGGELENAVSIDVGLQYQIPTFQVESLKITPSFGLSLTDFGMPVHYDWNDHKLPMPMTLRAGTGVAIQTDREFYGLKVSELQLFGSLSKIMARNGITITYENGQEQVDIDVPGPVETLFTSWDTYQWISYEMPEYSLSEQIWTHAGAQLTLFETLSFRYGMENAGKVENPFSYKAFGVGLDLYYIAIDYTKAELTGNLDVTYGYTEGRHWQLTGRIPLDGQRPKTILHHLFD